MVPRRGILFRRHINGVSKGVGQNGPFDSKELFGGLPKPTRAKPIGQIDAATSARFERLVQRRENDECWPWLGGSTTKGYGRFKIAKSLFSAHRVAYAIACGSVPDWPGYHGAVIMHSCDNPGCCNPHHLSMGTNKMNAIDMVAKGRNRHPYQNRGSSLSS